jgi:hypothetical protein
MVVAGEPLSRLSLGGWELKRNVVVGRLSLGCVDAIPEQAQSLRYDFNAVAFAAAVFCLVLAGGQPSFYVNLAAFAEESLAPIGQLSECDNPMPISALLFPAVAIRKPLRSRQ